MKRGEFEASFAELVKLKLVIFDLGEARLEGVIRRILLKEIWTPLFLWVKSEPVPSEILSANYSPQ